MKIKMEKRCTNKRTMLYSKNNEKLVKQNQCKTRKQERRPCLKCSRWTTKPNYMSHKISDNNLVIIRKIKVTLMFNKAAYDGMCTLKLSKV